VITFHKILSGCEAGNRQAWQTFLSEYTPVALQLLGVYLPGTPEQRLDFWSGAVRALSDGDFQGLRAFSHQSEREFLVDLRAHLLERVSTQLGPPADANNSPCPSQEALAAVLKGLPLLHQEIVFLTLAGYSQGTIEKMMRISPSMAQDGFERLRADYAPVLDRAEDCCLWPAAWLEITRAARAAKTQDCAPIRALIRILDGQASWYDKTPIEEHRASCLHCLELWTSLLEVVCWERAAQPWPAEKAAPLLTALPLGAGEPARKSFMARIFHKQ